MEGQYMKQSTNQKLVKYLVSLTGTTLAALKTFIDMRVPSFPLFLELDRFLELYTKTTADGKVLKPHPRQREVTERFKKAAGARGHLSKFCLAHTEIVVALFRGNLYLVDGNHRAKLWLERPHAERPSHVTLIVKQFQDDEEAAFTSLYYAYDSKAAQETGSQKVYGYMSGAGYANLIKTKFVTSGRFLSALKQLGEPYDNHEAEVLAGWEKEILAFDTDLSRDEKAYHCGVIAALLLLYRSNPHKDVSAFFEQIQLTKYTRKVAQQFDRPLTGSQKVIDDLDHTLKQVLGRNNEGIITEKKKATLSAFVNFQAARRAETQRQAPARRAKKAAA